MTMDYDYLKECFDYQDGKLVWRERPLHHFNGDRRTRTRINNIYAGKVAGSEYGNKYLRVNIAGKGYLLHRVIWHLLHKTEPPEQIDHKNGDPSDNRIENLRCVSVSGNAKNRKLSTLNKSGEVGVYYETSRKKWKATVYSEGKIVFQKRFTSFDDAVDIVRLIRSELGFTERHGQS